MLNHITGLSRPSVRPVVRAPSQRHRGLKKCGTKFPEVAIFGHTLWISYKISTNSCEFPTEECPKF